MSIFLLRHEERFEPPSFFTPLTRNGLNNAEKLIDKLIQIPLDEIYCSPFLRTVQTIYPYCISNNREINIENSLYEINNPHICQKNNYQHRVSELECIHPKYLEVVNNDYDSFLELENMKWPDRHLEDLYRRVVPFIEYLRENKQGKNILLVSHMSTINVIKNYLLHGQVAEKDSFYPTGHLEEFKF
jgi:broad specificity phosphatase PhoE